MTTSIAVRLRLPLEGFSIEVDFSTSRPVTGVFGPSGAGKTSLLESVAGLRRDGLGSIAFGRDVWQDTASRRWVPPEGRRIGYVPQDFLLFPILDVRGNLLSGAARGGAAGASIGATFAEVVRILELEQILARNVSTLSGGERQRVALGRALCSAPRLLLLDEPMSSLDLPLRHRILPFLRAVRERFPIPTLVVSHEPTVLQALCDEVLVMHEGRVVHRGDPLSVFSDPAIFPLAEREGFQNVIPCVVHASGQGTTAVRLGATGLGPELQARQDGELPRGRSTFVGIRASDILIGTERPRGLSARNVVPARIVDVAVLDDVDLIRLSLGPAVGDVVAEVTAAACEELGLVPGRPVFLVVKSSACLLFG